MSPGTADPDAAWFDRARFGMFIHVSHANGQGWELSWPLVGGIGSLPVAPPVSFDEWYAHVDEFRPAADCADQWCAAAAGAGAGYVVVVAKHHDGVANFTPRRPSRHLWDDRDLVAEVAAATRSHGLQLGIYFSLSDWGQPDYPAWSPALAPYTLPYPAAEPAAWDRFRALLLDQLDQLLDHRPRYVWFDGGWERSGAQWGAPELEAHIRSRVPGVLINDRLPGARADVTTPEQLVPAQPPATRWEACVTMNRSWGWVPGDTAYKSAEELVWMLCEIAGKGGNLLLNVSPTADGSLPPAQQGRLETIGRWMERNREAIVDTTPGLDPWQWYGPSTRRDGRWYAIATMRPTGRVTVRGIPTRRVTAIGVLGWPHQLRWTERVSALDEAFNRDPIGTLVIDVPAEALDAIATVVTIDIADGPVAR
jgi:alpha-L-fucosidase